MNWQAVYSLLVSSLLIYSNAKSAETKSKSLAADTEGVLPETAEKSGAGEQRPPSLNWYQRVKGKLTNGRLTDNCIGTFFPTPYCVSALVLRNVKDAIKEAVTSASKSSRASKNVFK